MKITKLVSYLLLITMFIGLGCNDNFEEVSLDEVSEEHKSSLLFKNVSIDEIPEVASFFESRTKRAVFTAKGENDAIFDVDNILEVIDTLQNTNYSFSFTFPDSPKYEVYNLVVGIDPSGQNSTPIVLKYTCSPEHYDLWEASGFDFSHFTGTLDQHKYTDFFDNGYFSRGDCAEYDSNGNPLHCVREDLINGLTVTGGGPAGTAGGENGPIKSGPCSYSSTYHQCNGPDQGSTHPEGPNDETTNPTGCGDPTSGFSGSYWTISADCSNGNNSDDTYNKSSSKGDCGNCNFVPTGSLGINLNWAMFSRIKYLSGKLKTEIGFSSEHQNFMVHPDNWELTEVINVFWRQSDKGGQAKQFVKDFLDKDYDALFARMNSHLAYTSYDPCPNPPCAGNFDAAVVLTVQIVNGAFDGMFNLLLWNYEGLFTEYRRGRIIRNVMKESGIDVPSDVTNETLQEIFKTRVRDRVLVLEPANNGLKDELLDVGISLLDVLAIVSPSKGGGAYFFVKNGVGKITAATLSKYMKVLAKGKWKTFNESMSDAAKSYQEFISGRKWNESFELNNVRFDALRNGILGDAKSGFLNFVNPNGTFKPFFSKGPDLIDQARRQLNAADGLPVEWHFEHKIVRDAFENLFRQEGFQNLTLTHTPR